jgi:hypothetical protein
MNLDGGSARPDETTGNVTAITGSNGFTLNTKDEDPACDAHSM